MKKKFLSKLNAVILTALLVLTSAMPSFAAETTIELITLYGFSNYHNVSDWGIIPNANITMFKVNGKTAFCTQSGRGVRDKEGNPYVPGQGSVVGDYTASAVTQDNSMQAKIAYLGYYCKNAPTDKDYAFTQMFIWQSLPSSYKTANGMTGGVYNSYFNDASIREEYEEWKALVQDKLNKWDTAPSFDSMLLRIDAGATVTLDDTNGVLADYPAFACFKNGITVVHQKGDNFLIVTAEADCSNKTVIMTEDDIKDAGGEKYGDAERVNYVYNSEGSQDITVYGNVLSPLGLSLKFDVKAVKGKIAIEKAKSPDASSDTAEPEQGAEFEVYLKSAGSYEKASKENRDIIITDAAGKAMTKELPHGTYTVIQTKGAEGHKLAKAFDVTIGNDEHDKVYTYKISNETMQSKIKIVKTDAETRKTIPRAGVEYELINLTTGKRIAGMPPKGYFVTDKDGIINLPEPLFYGDYRLIEITAPEGYVLANPIDFKVDGSQKTLTVSQGDHAQKGVIRIKKTGSILSSVKEKDGMYIPVYKDSGLSGIKFEIYASEDIETADGTVRAKKGELVDTVTTDEGGSAQSIPLYIGSYQVREIQGQDGFVIDDKPYKADIKYAGQAVEVTAVDISLKNVRQKAYIDFFKCLENDKLFGIYAEDFYKAVKFGLFASQEITAADGSVIPKDGLLEITGIEKEGDKYYGKFTIDIPNGEYYVKEVKSDKHYISDETRYPVSFNYDDKSGEIVNITLNDGKPIENKIIRGSISGLKVNAEGEPLEGAVIGLFKENEEIFQRENAILTDISSEKGKFEFKDVAYGNYIVREIEAAEGYVLADEEIPVFIGENQAEINISIINEKVPKTGDKADLNFWIITNFVATLTIFFIYCKILRYKRE